MYWSTWRSSASGMFHSSMGVPWRPPSTMRTRLSSFGRSSLERMRANLKMPIVKLRGGGR